MIRTFLTTAEQDAAIAWKAAQSGISEDLIIAGFATKAVADVVAAYRDAEGSRVYDAYKTATAEQQDAVKVALGLDAK